MTRIGQSDRVLLLLREQLQRIDRGRARRSERSGAGDRATPAAMERVKALAAFDSLPDDELRRTLLRALLTEELGDGLANDPALQSVADDVFRIIGESEDGRALLERAVRQLRAGGG